MHSIWQMNSAAGKQPFDGSVPVQVRGRVTAMQGCKQRWLRMSSAVCASAAWRTSSMHPARICHRALRSVSSTRGHLDNLPGIRRALHMRHLLPTENRPIV